MYLNKVKSHYNYIPLSSKKGITFVFIKTSELWPDVLQCLNIGMQLGAVTHLRVQYWWCTVLVYSGVLVVYHSTSQFHLITPRHDLITRLVQHSSSAGGCVTFPSPA